MSLPVDQVARFAVDLDRDYPTLHQIGLIQPYGVLLAFREVDLEILQVSQNTQTYLGIAPEALLGQPLSRFLEPIQVQALQQGLQVAGELSYHLKLLVPTLTNAPPEAKPQQPAVGGMSHFDALLHRTEGAMILELEPIGSDSPVDLLSLHHWLRTAIAALHKTTDLTEFLQVAVMQVQAVTGFDRVHVYQFDQHQAGSVIAEAKRHQLPSYLGLHYPATDIPRPARELYARGMLRHLPQVFSPSVELLPAQNPDTQQPLDLSLVGLRGIDACCVEYYRNMGVAANLVIPLVQEGHLWGLISCHHPTPRLIPYEVRTVCEMLGQFVASELTNKVNHEELDYIARLRAIQSDFVGSIAQAENFIDALVEPAPRLLELVNAGGAAICLDAEIALVGQTPTIEQVQALITWVDIQGSDRLFHTDSLPRLYPEATAYKEVASGVLVLQISQVRRYFILWFRPEVLQTVNWAGDPQDSMQVQPDGNAILCPRSSFALWQETVSLTCLPWKTCELENALDLRSAIVGIVLTKADELARINQELERSNRELDSFAYAASHDLKEPLRGIHNFSNMLLKSYAGVLDEIGVNRLKTLVRLTQRMEALIDVLFKFSRLGQTELHRQSTDLNSLVKRVIEVLTVSRQDQEIQPQIRIPRPLPTVMCDPVLVSEVFSNLLSNAYKYNDKPEQWIEIGYLDQEPCVFYVRDNGIGIRDRHHDNIFKLFKRLHEQNKYGGGTGAGLTISKKIIERHQGRIWVESIWGEGSSFYFTLE